MSSNLFYTIEFKARREHIDISQELTAAEYADAVEQALFIAEAVIFFITEKGEEEIDGETLRIYRLNVREILNQLFISALSNNYLLEEQRKKLEQIVSQQ